LIKNDPAGLLLAAGASKRFGSPKQLLDWGGITLIEHAINTIRNSGIDDLIVVLGDSYDEISTKVPVDVRIVINNDYGEGKSTSIKAGLKEIERLGRDHVMIFLVDQPFLRVKDISNILDVYKNEEKAGIIATRVKGVIIQPVLYHKKHFGNLCRLIADQGGKTLIQQAKDVVFVESDNTKLLLDIDTFEDYQTLKKKQLLKD